VTLILPGLRYLYWDHKRFLGEEELTRLRYAISQSDPELVGDQVEGVITPFDVLQIPTQKFWDLLHRTERLTFQLVGVPIIVEANYTPYDFWDPQAERVALSFPQLQN
jgi:hypothetical protein